MKRFEFRLERVRRLRKQLAELEESRLAPLFAELHALQTARQQLAEQEAATIEATLNETVLPAMHLAALDRFRRWSQEQYRRQEARIADCQKRIADQQNKVLEARRAYQLFDPLHRRALQAWKAEYERELQQLAGDVVLSAWGRRRLD